MTRKRLRRGQMLTFFAGLPPGLVGMEACATAQPEQAGGAYLQIERQVIGLQRASLSADRAKDLAEAMEHIIMKLDVDSCRTVEDALLDLADFGPAASNTADWIIHRGFVRGVPVALHQR